MFWIMPLWSEEEITKLQNLYEQENMNVTPVWGSGEAYYTPLETFRLLGPSASKCFDPRGNPKTSQGPGVDFKNYLDPETIFDNVHAFYRALNGGRLADIVLHRFLFGVDGSNSGNPSQGMVLRYHVPTNFLRRVLSSCLRGCELEEQSALAAHLAGYPQVASVLYEPLVIDFLQLSENPHECCLVDGSTFSLGPGLSVALKQVNFQDSFDPDDNCIYVPHSGCESINAVVFSENKTRVTLLHMTVAYKHKVDHKDFATVIEALKHPQSVKNWSFIFVTPRSCW